MVSPMSARNRTQIVCALAAALAAFALASAPAGAAIMSASLSPPTVDGPDIANYDAAATGADKWWAENNTGAGSAKGQTFTTGSEDVLLNAITYQVVSTQQAEPTKGYVIRVGEVLGTSFTELHSETATQTFTWNSSEYMTWTLDSPILLTAGKVYGVDIGMTSSTSAWQSGIPYLVFGGNGYGDGNRYTTGQNGVGTATIINDAGRDRVFHLDLLEAYDTLTWDGLGDGNWSTASWLDEDDNPVAWFPDVPTPANAAIHANTVTVASNREAMGLTVDGSGAAVAVHVADSATLTVKRVANFADGASLRLGANAGFIAGSGSIASVALAANATVTVTDGDLGVASMTGAGGTLTKQGAGTLHLPASDLAAAAGEVVLDGGTLQVKGDITLMPGLTLGSFANPRPMDMNTPNPGGEVDPLGPTMSEGGGWSANTTYVYTGEIFDADGMISFFESIDDDTWVKIDGQVVLSDTVWNVPKASGTVNVAPGWVDFEVRFNGGGGGMGKQGDMGFGFDPAGVATSTLPADYILPRNSDADTADLFRTESFGAIDMTAHDRQFHQCAHHFPGRDHRRDRHSRGLRSANAHHLRADHQQLDAAGSDDRQGGVGYLGH